MARTLAKGIFKTWKKFRRRARRGVPGSRDPDIDKEVHDLRSSARRFHSVARALPPSASGKPARRAIALARQVLDWTGDTRDAAVEREGLKSVTPKNSDIARRLDRDLKLRRNRGAERIARGLLALKLGKAHRGMKKLSRSLRKGDAPRVASEMIEGAFGELRRARVAADPVDARSLHKLRIELKRFRYVVDLFDPIFPHRGGGWTSSIQSLQRTMGDLRDNQNLASELSTRTKQVPNRLPEIAAVLEKLDELRGRMMRSFLKSVDAVLDHWSRMVQSFRAGMRDRPLRRGN